MCRVQGSDTNQRTRAANAAVERVDDYSMRDVELPGSASLGAPLEKELHESASTHYRHPNLPLTAATLVSQLTLLRFREVLHAGQVFEVGIECPNGGVELLRCSENDAVG